MSMQMGSLPGQMMDMPLMISSLIVYAAQTHGSTEIVSKRVEGDLHRYTWRDAERRSRQMAQMLARLGCQPGDRIGTLAWNGYRHLEIYYGTSGSGLVCHTINPRLFPEQIAWIVNDAQDQVLFVDLNLVPLVEKLAPHFKGVRHVIVMTDRARMPAGSSLNLLCYEDLIEAEDGQYVWPEFDERAAASLCYTSGTTGNPKGALYSHRSTVLLSYAVCSGNVMNLSQRETVLPVVPMFHVNAWAIPYAAAMAGCKLVMPGPFLDGKSLYELFEAEGVTFAAGVPTIWLGLLNHVQQHQLRFSTFRRSIVGGAAVPPSMIAAFAEPFGVQVLHGWGMTEMSPVGSLSGLMPKHDGLSRAEQIEVLAKQGKALPGIRMRIVDAEGRELPWDGQASGDLEVRGPWVISRYYNVEQSPLHDGWFNTGDVANIDPDGYMHITDRSKDVIKSGGEWISSIDIENVAMAHPAVAEAAAIAVPHPKWDERPLLVVALKPGAQVSAEELIRFYDGKVAKWQIPDDVAFVSELPHTATGKVLKAKLREQFRQHVLPSVEAPAR